MPRQPVHPDIGAIPPPQKPFLSVCIITGNEEENIRRCLESVRWADEIVIVDSFSTDRTVEIAREFTMRIYQHRWTGYIGQKATGTEQPRKAAAATGELPPEVIENSLAVDAACSGNPGQMEYRGVHVASRQQVFHFGPVYGTNNIGEFLALVHGLALLKQKGIEMPIYSDSRNAISWVRQKQCKTKLPREPRTEALFLLIERAEKWLRENTYTTPILKWETELWGEIPADFGRKG